MKFGYLILAVRSNGMAISVGFLQEEEEPEMNWSGFFQKPGLADFSSGICAVVADTEFN